MAKKKNSRKVLAVALGIMGIAGLSLASASQLNITASGDNIATGLGSFTAACDTAVSAAYTTTTAPFAYAGVDVSGISDACYDKTLTWTLNYATSPGGVPSSEFGTVSLAGTGTGDFTKTINITDLPVAGYSLTSLAITIN